MVKPILVIYLGTGNSSMNQLRDNIAQMQKVLEKLKIADEYYILILPNRKEDSSVEVFYERDFNKVSYTKLKSILEKKIKSFLGEKKEESKEIKKKEKSRLWWNKIFNE